MNLRSSSTHRTRLPTTPSPDKRRSFLNWFLGTSAAALLVSALYRVVRFLIPPKAEESSAVGVTLDLKVGEVKPNTGRIVKFGKQPAILLRTPAGELRVFAAICTHLACVVQYREDLRHIWCACHNGHYDQASGKNITGPPPRPLAPYVVNVREEKVVVSRGAWGHGGKDL
jgi:Rieske Fe-S protein